MTILPVWLCSILASLGIEVSTVFKVFKEAADQGYKINVEKIQTTEEQKFKKGNTFTTLMIPGVNISKSVKLRDEYHESKNERMTYLAILGALEKMSDEEKFEYQMKPTALNAMLISARTLKREPETIEYNLKENTSFEDMMREFGLNDELFKGMMSEESKKSNEQADDAFDKAREKIREAEKAIKRYAEEHGINDRYELHKKELSILASDLMKSASRLMESAGEKLEEATKQMEEGPKLTNKSKNDDK